MRTERIKPGDGERWGEKIWGKQNQIFQKKNSGIEKNKEERGEEQKRNQSRDKTPLSATQTILADNKSWYSKRRTQNVSCFFHKVFSFQTTATSVCHCKPTRLYAPVSDPGPVAAVENRADERATNTGCALEHKYTVTWMMKFCSLVMSNKS